MLIVKVLEKGQIVIPKEAREKAKLFLGIRWKFR